MKHLIADNVTCAYCDTVPRLDHRKHFHCSQHGELELGMKDNPGYPAVVNETHASMYFFFSRVKTNTDFGRDQSTTRIAAGVGCPYCTQNLSKTRRNAPLMDQQLRCNQCRKHFGIEFVRQGKGLQMFFVETSADDQVNQEPIPPAPQTDVPPVEKTIEPTIEMPVDTRLQTPVETTQKMPTPALNAKKDVAGQVMAYLRAHKTATTAEMKESLDTSPPSLNEAVNKLIASGEIMKIRRGVYQITNTKNKT